MSPAAADDNPQRLLPRLMSFLLGGLRAPLPGGALAGANN